MDNHLREHNQYGENLYCVETDKFETMIEEASYCEIMAVIASAKALVHPFQPYKGKSVDSGSLDGVP